MNILLAALMVLSPFTFREMEDQLDQMTEQWLEWAEEHPNYETVRLYYSSPAFRATIEQWYYDRPARPGALLLSWIRLCWDLYGWPEWFGSDQHMQWIVEHFAELTDWPVDCGQYECAPLQPHQTFMPLVH